LGIDVVENDRIAKSLERFGERFLRRVYTPKEVEYCFSFKDPVPCLAARWAAKEAAVKAFFQLFGVVLKFKQIEVEGRKGLPARIRILGKESKMLEGYKVVLSLAHERSVSVAVVQILKSGSL